MEQKVAVITGSSKGIGKSLTEKFEKESIIVVGFSRTTPQGNLSHWVQGDINRKEDRDRLKNEVIEKYGRIDILINNAGVALIDSWEETEEADLRIMYETNFFSLVELSRLFVSELKKTQGTIINVSSVLGKLPVACMGGYCATKSALNAFSNSLRIELKPLGIHVLTLTVGLLKTDFLANALGSRQPPPFPGAGCPDKLANKTFRAYMKRKREITYPEWYTFYLPSVWLTPRLYEYFSIKTWKLDLSDK
ncbi:MAG: SDR family NAD(P)-dependent oxidoreductase [Desulfobulbaceae bacterium]|nr:SDR family NAD(P)-dependent oxidoreductase [Desulfobulbaceae bacterium]